MAVKHRCPYCRKVLREDRTCQNPQCVMYVPEPEDNTETPKSEGIAEVLLNGLLNEV